MGKNTDLTAAKAAKNDEFYTQWRDIEAEMLAYTDFNPDVFRDKTLLLPCDDPAASNFTKFFALNFESLGLKKLISTSYAPASNPAVEEHGQLTLGFELGEDTDPKFTEQDTWERGRIYVLERGHDTNGDGRLNKDDLQWDYLDGDGDFRSEEITALRDEADMVITNPPFSLFREFIAWIMAGNVQFSIIGNKNAITYKEVFPLFRDNQIWLGNGFTNGNAYFQIPEHLARDYASGVLDPSTCTVHFRNTDWFTNIPHGKRYEPLDLMTMADNKLYGPKKIVEDGYPRYDNYDAIEVPATKGIPSDYDGVMGVPISFLDKYNPEQFAILGITKTWDTHSDLKTKVYPTQTQVSASGKKSRVGKLNDGAAIPHSAPPKGVTYYEVDGQFFTQAYARILIHHRNPKED